MIVSKLAGRIRLQDEKLKEAAFAKDLCKQLRAIKGVRKARHTELIGSLLVEYNMKTVPESEVLAFLNQYVNCEKKPVSSGPFEPLMSELKAATKGEKPKPSGRGRSRRQKAATETSAPPHTLSDLLKHLVPFAEGSSPLGNILKTILPGLLGYKAYQAGRGLMGGGKKN